MPSEFNNLDGIFLSNTFKFSNYKSQKVLERDDISIHRHRGIIMISLKGEDNKIRINVKYLDVLRKNEDRVCKIYMHTVIPID